MSPNYTVANEHYVSWHRDWTSTRNILVWSLALCVAIQFIPWLEVVEHLTGQGMIDREVYRRGVETYDLPIDFLPEISVLKVFTYELLWNWAFAFVVRDLGVPVDLFFGVITTAVLWRFCFLVTIHAGYAYSLLLLNPLVIDLAYSQLRIALAIMLVSLFWSRTTPRWLLLLAYLIGTSIHTSMIAVAAIQLSAQYIDAPRRRSVALLVATGSIIAVATGPLRELLLSTVADRRVDYVEMSSSALYLSFWIAMGLAMMFHRQWSMRDFECRLSLVVLSLVIGTFILDGYSTRWIAIFYPFLIIALAKFPTRTFNVATAIFIPYAIIQWGLWLQL